MKFSSRMTVAIHILLYLAEYEQEEKVTSEVLADTTGVNAVNIRKTLQLLKQAGFIEIRRGIGGACLKKAPEDITVKDIFDAVEDSQEDLFHMHEHPNTNCPVGRSIKGVLDGHLDAWKCLLMQQMQNVTLKDLFVEMQDEMKKHP
ncbi:Rrf2 family transcriptional regulator [uncultured Mitsuokella sp.]|uniref:Rrf2 family transcriptional regulator n=1 Tax=uncultured Mitsuokella sp. TaxID=453120 RepID=UPI0026DC49C3|nr:Rrf2 family transcriptional regulator [uncultured Mitsuokella sp.]